MMATLLVAATTAVLGSGGSALSPGGTTVAFGGGAAAFSFGKVSVDCPKPAGWTISLTRETSDDGGEIARIVCTSPTAAKPPRFTVATDFPQVDLTDLWEINTSNCQLPPDWGRQMRSDLAHGMPLAVGFNQNDQATFSVAASECVRPVQMRVGVYDDGRLVTVPDDGKPTYLMNATGRDTLTVRCGTSVRDVLCRSGNWVRIPCSRTIATGR